MQFHIRNVSLAINYSITSPLQKELLRSSSQSLSQSCFPSDTGWALTVLWPIFSAIQEWKQILRGFETMNFWGELERLISIFYMTIQRRQLNSTIVCQSCKIIKSLQHFLRAKKQSLWQKTEFQCFCLKCFTIFKAYITKKQKYNFPLKYWNFIDNCESELRYP